MGYGIKILIKGDYACFTRPEMKVERVSYDIITPSAARGIIEAVYWKPAIRWIIDKIYVINPIKFTNIKRNEVAGKIPDLVPNSILKGKSERFFIDSNAARQQRSSMILKDVEYVVCAHFELTESADPATETVEKHYNCALRRFRKGQSYHQPYLGTREFGADVELLPDDFQIQSQLSGTLDLGWMLYDLNYSDPENIQPQFFKSVLEDGKLDLSHVELVR